MGAHPERSDLNTIADCAARAEDGLLEAELQKQKDIPKEGRTWGRFPNRVSGPQPHRPARDDGGMDRNKGQEQVRANAITPQPRMDPNRTDGGRHPDGGRNRRARKGRRVSREKRDQLRAEGKCFQCEQVGHSQRDCPELNMMRPPAIRANNVNIARLERLAKTRGKADLQMGHISMVGNDEVVDDLTPAMHKVYKWCAATWGEDNRWLDPATRYQSKYGIYQYGTRAGDVMEIILYDEPGVRPFEVDVSRFINPELCLADMLGAKANTTPACVREGGFRDNGKYDTWKWPALEWLRQLLTDQLKLEESGDTVSVKPSYEGYGLHLKGTDVYYEITHTEMLGSGLHIGRVLNAMRTVKGTTPWERSPMFWDKRITKWQSLMALATRLTAGSVRHHKQVTEGANSLEKTSMQVKDQTRKVPEPIVVLAYINGHEVRALVDTGSMADFVSTTVIEQLKLKKEVYTKPLSAVVLIKMIKTL
ncbi:hypothetical protein BJ322DRAFT_1105211 [Thelephora terrestris]|uniref:CCHC-type domain-containing protein n=1 Tax=Thelephora terrestris TaxID=56493 RepID=A0A9P6LA22_9AGAM|nr:hypothetical protein BJ322DRAFT_1105211 [Thelephora terrestris]